MQQHTVITLALVAAIFSVITVFVLGCKRKAVIYIDNNDLGTNILPLPLLLNGYLLYLTTDGHDAKIAIAYISGAIILAIMLYNFYRSLKLNSFLPIPLNVFVAMVKSLVSIFAIMLVPFWMISNEDDQGPKSDKAAGGFFMVLLTTLTGHLVNGNEVYAARGCSDGVYEQKEEKGENKST